jgi:hypothetical protein
LTAALLPGSRLGGLGNPALVAAASADNPAMDFEGDRTPRWMYLKRHVTQTVPRYTEERRVIRNFGMTHEAFWFRGHGLRDFP